MRFREGLVMGIWISHRLWIRSSLRFSGRFLVSTATKTAYGEFDSWHNMKFVEVLGTLPPEPLPPFSGIPVGYGGEVGKASDAGEGWWLEVGGWR